MLSFPGSAKSVLLRSQLGSVAAHCVGLGGGPCTFKPIAWLSFFSRSSSQLLMEMGTKLSGLRNLNHSHFSALGVICQFIVEKKLGKERAVFSLFFLVYKSGKDFGDRSQWFV